MRERNATNCAANPCQAAGAGRHHRAGRRGPGAGEGEHGGRPRGERAVT